MFHSNSLVPLPDFFNPNKVAEIYRVPYQQRAKEAQLYAQKHSIKPAVTDKTRSCL